MMRYAVIIEKGVTIYGAYVLDVPRCIAVGDTDNLLFYLGIMVMKYKSFDRFKISQHYERR